MVELSAVLTFIVSFLLGAIPWGVVISKLVYKDDVRKHGSGNIGTTNMIRTYGKGAGYAVFVLDFAKGVVSGLLALLIFALMVVPCAVGVSAYVSGAEDAAASAGGVFAGLAGFADFVSSAGFAGVESGAIVSFAGNLFGANDFKNILLAISFAGSIWGHIFSPFLNFKGGKGIATAVGNEFVSITPIGAVIELLIFGVLTAATKFVSVGSIAASIACLPISLYVFWGNPSAILFMWAGALTVFWAHRENLSRLIKGKERKVGSKNKPTTERS